MSWNEEEYIPEVQYIRPTNPIINTVRYSEANPTGVLNGLNPHVESHILEFLAPKGTTIRRGVSSGRTLEHLRTPSETARFLKFKNQLNKEVKKREWERVRPELQAQRNAIFRRGREGLAAEQLEIQARMRQQQMEHERHMLNLENARRQRHAMGDYSNNNSNNNNPRPVNPNLINGGRNKKYNKKTRKNKKNKRRNNKTR